MGAFQTPSGAPGKSYPAGAPEALLPGPSGAWVAVRRDDCESGLAGRRCPPIPDLRNSGRFDERPPVARGDARVLAAADILRATHASGSRPTSGTRIWMGCLRITARPRLPSPQSLGPQFASARPFASHPPGRQGWPAGGSGLPTRCSQRLYGRSPLRPSSAQASPPVPP